MDVFGIVLAGGRSRRMNGSDKIFADLGGRTLLAHVLDRLRPQCDGVVISANGDPALFDTLRVPVVADDHEGFLGPVAGLLAGLDWIAAHRPSVTLAVSAAVDTPFLPSDLVERLRQAAASQRTSAACAASGGRRHPVAALWPMAARHDLRRAFDGGRRRLAEAIESLGCALAEWPTTPLDPFLNVNTPDDLDLARGLVSHGF